GADQWAGVVRTNNHWCLRPDQRCRVETPPTSRILLGANGAGESRPEACASDLRSPGGLETGASFAHGSGDRLLAGAGFRLHGPGDIADNPDAEFHAGRRSTVQTSRSRSRTGSP